MKSQTIRTQYAVGRRHFLKKMTQVAAMGASGTLITTAARAASQKSATPNLNTESKKKRVTLRDFAKRVVLKRETLDWFLDPGKPNWAQFDPVLGYVLHDSTQKDGMNGAWTVYRYDKKYGHRKLINYPDQPCRVNTYGDSFTQCHQVSDGETWQEYLAAHFGEPIRNYGVGGYGVYQAYRRMLRMEKTEVGTPYVILNIWGVDDHYRSLDTWRYTRAYGWFRNVATGHNFHANPWDHLEVDPDTGKMVEKKNICPTPESLYKLCDVDYICDTFKDDFALNLYLGCRPNHQVNTGLLQRLAESLELKLDFSTPDKRARSTSKLYMHCAFEASMWILDRTVAFTKSNNKKLLVLLSYNSGQIRDACAGKPRIDQPFIDKLNKTDIRYVDIIPKHLADFKRFNLTPSQYCHRYYIGHYKPLGNHFFAFAIKDDMVNWLDPKPPAYRKKGPTIRFEGYLPS